MLGSRRSTHATIRPVGRALFSQPAPAKARAARDPSIEWFQATRGLQRIGPNMSASTFVPAKIYACCRCGARSYHRVIGRDRDGAMRPTGLYHCSGCSAVFADPRAWRDGLGDLRGDPDAGGSRRSRGLFPAT